MANKKDQPKQRISAPASVTFVNGKKHITIQVTNTQFSDWMDKQELRTRLNLSDNTVRYLRRTKKIPYSRLGDGKYYYYIPGILTILEQNMCR